MVPEGRTQSKTEDALTKFTSVGGDGDGGLCANDVDDFAGFLFGDQIGNLEPDESRVQIGGRFRQLARQSPFVRGSL